jgi:hypothetical protein
MLAFLVFGSNFYQNEFCLTKGISFNGINF